MSKNRVYVLLGGNLGDTKETFEKALEFITVKVGTIRQTSRLYESEPWGFESRYRFLNQVIELETELSAPQVMHELLNIERMLGRMRGATAQYQSRHIDLDILFYNEEIFDHADLTIPHPRLHLRRFTLMPLDEIASTQEHPVLKKSVRQLLEQCEDHLEVNVL